MRVILIVLYTYHTMGSISAQVVAQKVSGTIRKGKKVVLKDILIDSGYSEITADSPSLVTNTNSYKKALSLESFSLMEELDKEIEAIKKAMSLKDKTKEEYRTLVGSLDIMVKNKHLLSGGVSTLNVFVLPSEVMTKDNIIKSGDAIPNIDNNTANFE